MSGRRALHFVFKIGDRDQTMKFFREILGMKVLRHEEFDEGCKATCNGCKTFYFSCKFNLLILIMANLQTVRW